MENVYKESNGMYGQTNHRNNAERIGKRITH